MEGDYDPFSRLSLCGVTSGPDFWEGDYLKTSHTQDKLVLYLGWLISLRDRWCIMVILTFKTTGFPF